jgi:hypothetical protein
MCSFKYILFILYCCFSGCNWPFLAVVKHVNKCIELKWIIIIIHIPIFIVLILILIIRILVICAYSLGLSETILLLPYIVVSRSVPQPEMFLLPMQSVGASTSLIKIVFGLLISVRILNKNICSLSLYYLFVFNCFLLCFLFFNFSACL